MCCFHNAPFVMYSIPARNDVPDAATSASWHRPPSHLSHAVNHGALGRRAGKQIACSSGCSNLNPGSCQGLERLHVFLKQQPPIAQGRVLFSYMAISPPLPLKPDTPPEASTQSSVGEHHPRQSPTSSPCPAVLPAFGCGHWALGGGVLQCGRHALDSLHCSSHINTSHCVADRWGLRGALEETLP